MAIVIFIDTTSKYESLATKFENERHSIKQLSLVNDASMECIESSVEKVLIWHVSSSKICIDDEISNISLKNIKTAVEILNKCQFNYKFGVTDNDLQYKQEVKKAWDFNDVESWDELKYRFKEGLQKGIKGQDKVIKATATHILHLFLPLDIDMQALKIIHKDVEERRREEKEILDYLTSLEEPKGMLRSSIDFEQNLNKAFLKVKKTEEFRNNTEINKLLEDRRMFMKILDDMKKRIENEGAVDTAREAIKKYLDTAGDIFWGNVHSFHKWYSNLAKCIRSVMTA